MRRLGLFTILAFLLVAIAVPVKVFAYETASQEALSPNAASRDECLALSAGKDEICLNGYAANVVSALSKLIGNSMTYADFENASLALANGKETFATSRLLNADPSFLGMTLSLNYSLLDQRPASGVVFALDRIENASSPEPVYAAEPQPYFPGTGFELMQPIQAFWGWAVAVAYSFMILIIIAVAFALMFRAKLDGQQVVQLQNAIPGIVLAMILIPLSYPISGLFIDGISLGTNAVHGFVFGQGGPGRAVYEEGSSSGTPFNTEEGRGLYADDWRVNVFRVHELIGIQSLGVTAGNVICPDSATTGDCIDSSQYGVLNFIDQLIKFIVAEPEGQSGIGYIIGELLNLLFSLMAIVVSFRIAWRLIKKLLVLMFMPIISPFIFATVAIPGTGMKSLTGYLKNLGAASLNYIVSYALFLFAIIFTNEAFFRSIPNVQTYKYTPPLLGVIGQAISGGTTDTVNLAGTSTGMLFTLLGAGLFLSIPKILDTIDEKLGVEQGFIPKALQPYVDDIKYSGDVAFRKAPATGRAVGGTALSLAATPFNAAFKRFGGYKPTPFDYSRGEQYVLDRREKMSEMAADAANKKGLSKVVANARLGLAGARSSAGATLRGQSGAFAVKKAEGATSLQVSLDFDLIRANFQGSDDYTIKQRTLKTQIDPGGKLYGVFTVEAAKDTTPPAGSLVFKDYDGGTAIAKLVNESLGQTAFLRIKTKAMGGGGHEFRLVDGAIQITDKTGLLTGLNKTKINVYLDMPAPLPSYLGPWKAEGPNMIFFFIGTPDIGRPKPIRIVVEE
ncbi:hypothetical protein KC640_01930 [Candidatus Dojkabacteria bacterium]|uniref:Uncharacterized protein n=1 Tax=Candidatus Dojkabacteria bacterium TaxID=2099670 RepID=A0A955I9G8_9BACT|nr:hypothetical protein [Candidatus Dojkabacteria bacterium]